MARTIQQLAQEALDVQNACNLGGVSRSFAKAVEDLFEHTHGTAERNNHPIVRIWIDKMASLAGVQDLGNTEVMAAYRAVVKLAKGGAK
jgi:hypothetical protein